MIYDFKNSNFTIDVDKCYEEARSIIQKTVCPYCGTRDISKYGYTPKGRKRYICKKCARTFSETTGTPLYHSNKSISQWIEYIECMAKCYTLRDISAKLKISLTTSFQWRHKILHAVKDKVFDVEFSDKVEIGEAVMKKSYKGNHHGKLDYADPYPEIRILSCVDDCHRMVRGIDEPFIKKSNLDQVLIGKIRPCSIITTARNLSYKEFAHENNLEINMPEYGRVNKYSFLNNKRASMQGRRFILFTRDFYGVATRYVNFYSILYVVRLLNDNNSKNVFDELFKEFFISTSILREKDFKEIKLS